MILSPFENGLDFRSDKAQWEESESAPNPEHLVSRGILLTNHKSEVDIVQARQTCPFYIDTSLSVYFSGVDGGIGSVAAVTAVAKVVAKPATPLNGISIGIAHPSLKICGGWTRALKAAGAQTVRQISPETPTLGSSGDDSELATAPAGENGKMVANEEAVDRGGDGSSGAMRAIVQDLDYVLCDFPDVWECNNDEYGKPGGTTTEQQPTMSRRGSASTTFTPSRRSHDDSNGNSTLTRSSLAPPCFLRELVDAARRENVPVVSLSWAMDCVFRGVRIRLQSCPEYLSPFAQVI